MIDFTGGAQTGGIASRGWLGGGQVGHNWQYGRIVAGLEADFSFADIEGASRAVTQPGFGGTQTDTLGDKIKYLATARTRLGWLPIDSVMLYATAGPAWARMERIWTTILSGGGVRDRRLDDTGSTGSAVLSVPAPNGCHLDRTGSAGSNICTTISAGYATPPRLSRIVPGVISVSEHRGRQTIDVLRAGVSYKFN